MKNEKFFREDIESFICFELNYHSFEFIFIYLRRICVINKQNTRKNFTLKIGAGYFGVATPGSPMGSRRGS